MPVLSENEVAVKITIKKDGTGAEQAEKAVDSLSKKLKSQKANFKELGKAAVAMGIAAAGVLTLSVKAAVDFESAFAGVLKTTDFLGDSVNDLSDDGERFKKFLRDTAKETGATREGLSRIAEIAGQLGVDSVANLEKFTKTVQDISVSTDLTSEAAATSFARIANVMNEPLDNIDRMGASIVALGNNFATTEPEILAFANRISAAGSIAGLTTADLFGIATAFTSVGIKAEAGGTAVQKVLISMKQAASGSTSEVINNTSAIEKNKVANDKLNISLEKKNNRLKELKDNGKENSATFKNLTLDVDALKGKASGLNSELEGLNATNGKAVISMGTFSKVLGLTQKEFEKLFKSDPSKAFTTFIQKLKEIEDEGGDATSVLDELDLADQRLITGFLATASAGDLVVRSVEMANEEFEKNTALVEEAEKRYGTTAQQMLMFKQNISDIGVTIGSALLPALNDSIVALTPLLIKFAEFTEKHPKLVIGILASIAAIGALSGVIMVLAPIVAAFTGIMGAFGITVATAMLPVTLMAIAIGGLIVGIKAAFDHTEVLQDSLLIIAGTVISTIPLMGELGHRIADVGTSSRDAARAQEELLVAEENLAGFTADLIELQKRHERQLHNQKSSTINYRKAVENLSEAELKYGEDSDEAAEAAHRLEGAKLDLRDANDRTRESADKLADAHEKVVEGQDILKESTEKAAKAADDADSKWDKLRRTFGGIKGVLQGAMGFAQGLASFASFGGNRAVGGGTFPGKPFMVGERGPELFVPHTSGRIASNNETKEILGESQSGGGGPLVVIENFTANSDSDMSVFATQLAWEIAS